MTSTMSNPAPANVTSTAESLTATVRLPAPPERVFSALVSNEVMSWWVRPGVFDTREWSADLRVGGAWRASGMGGGKPYALEGEFLVVEAPRRLVHTWKRVGVPLPPSTVTYSLESVHGGTLLTLNQSGFASPDTCAATAEGWRTSLDRLVELLSAEHG